MQVSKLNLNTDFATLGEEFFSFVTPSGFNNPHLVSVNQDVAKLIGLEPQAQQQEWFLNWCSGNLTLPNSQPLAMVYAGHQFGQYVPQLGDGRGLLLAEIPSTIGNLDLHLKGAGPTPYSRFGDGRAVLRSTIREYLCSQAMAGLQIPTTLGLCIVGSDERVYREKAETGAMLMRLARTHIRFGTFEFFHHSKRTEQVKVLADYVIDRLLDDIDRGDYPGMFREIVQRTATLIAQWQAAGFSHGVMNTDNMSIFGETLDYGPYGFMEQYNPGYVCNHSDETGRYAFNQQPSIGLWNCNMLANALTSLISVEDLTSALHEYEPLFLETYYQLMGKKLGLPELKQDEYSLVNDLLTLLEQNQQDFSIFFRNLSHNIEKPQQLRDDFIDRDGFDQWVTSYQHSLDKIAIDPKQRQQQMLAINPKYILRNYLAENAIRKAEDEKDYSEIENLLTVFSNPFEEHPEFEDYAQPPPDWARGLSVSCSS